MTTTIHVEPAGGRANMWVVRAIRDDGPPAEWRGHLDRRAPAPSMRLRRWCETINRDVHEVVAAILSAGAPADAAAGGGGGGETDGQHHLRVRVLRETAEWRTVESLADAVRAEVMGADAVQADTVIEWRGTTHLAALDVDVVEALTDREAESILARTRPQGWLTWRTHGGGLRLLYSGSASAPADEVAALASLWLWDRLGDRIARTEILPRTRHPLGPRGRQRCGEVAETVQGRPTWPSAWSQEVDEAEVAAYLDRRGWHVGQRLSHEHCPIDPVPTTGQTPVIVREGGVQCWRCAAAGDGWRSWASLIGGELSPMQRLLHDGARHLAVWSHVWTCVRRGIRSPHLMPASTVREVAGLAYRALCRQHHGGDDPRIGSVTTDWRLVRGVGQWLDAETLAPILPGVSQRTTDALPSSRYVDDEGDTRIAPAAAGRAQTDQRLDGYTPVEPVRGAPVWEWTGREYAARDDDVVRVVVPPPGCAPPRYLPPESRAPIADWAREHLPGLDWAALRLVIAARWWAEGGEGAVPLVALTGPTGASKTATVALAAGIVGCPLGHVTWSQDEGRMREAIGEQAASSGILLLDEYAKAAESHRHSVELRRGAATSLLDLRRAFHFRRLRVGPVHVRLHAPLVITDTDLGEEWESYAQFARRLVHRRIPHTVPRDWRETVGETETIRSVPGGAAWADSVLSELVDLLRAKRPASWDETARLLGTAPLSEQVASSGTTRGASVGSLAARLYAEWQIAEHRAVDGLDGDGWVEIDPHAEAEASRVYRQLCSRSSRRLSDAALQRLARLREIDLTAVLPEVDAIDAAWVDQTLFYRFRAIVP